MSKKENKLFGKSVNVGTANKFLLQKQAIEFLREYPKDKTLKEYARLLCWDLAISQRTALENYIEPMAERLILIPSGNDCYRLNNGGVAVKEIEESATDYIKRKEKEKKDKKNEKD